MYKNITKKKLMVIVLSFVPFLASSQISLNPTGVASESEHKSRMEIHDFFPEPIVNETSRKGFHFDFEGFYGIPVGFSSDQKMERDGEAPEIRTVRSKQTVGLQTAFVYQFKSAFYLGGVTGVRMQQMRFTENENIMVTESYGVPLMARFGFCDAFSKKASYFGQIDGGVLLGTKDLKTSVQFEFQAGIYYGNAKIAVGTFMDKPKSKRIFGNETLKGGYNMAIALVLGLRI